MAGGRRRGAGGGPGRHSLDHELGRQAKGHHGGPGQSAAAHRQGPATRSLRPIQSRAEPPPPQAQEPTGPAPAVIAPATILKVKKATAYLKVTLGNGAVAEGSGFFA